MDAYWSTIKKTQNCTAIGTTEWQVGDVYIELQMAFMVVEENINIVYKTSGKDH